MRFTRGWYGMVRPNIQCVVVHWSWGVSRLMISVHCTYVNIYNSEIRLKQTTFKSQQYQSKSFLFKLRDLKAVYSTIFSPLLSKKNFNS